MTYDSRVQRIIGQLEGLLRLSDDGAECARILQQVKAIEGAVVSLRKHIIDESLDQCINSKDTQKEAQKIVNSIRRYM